MRRSVEAIAAAKLVIATNYEGVVEIVEDGKTGLLVRLAILKHWQMKSNNWSKIRFLDNQWKRRENFVATANLPRNDMLKMLETFTSLFY